MGKEKGKEMEKEKNVSKFKLLIILNIKKGKKTF